MSILAEFWAFLRQKRKLWMFPIIFMLVVVGGLLVIAQGSVVAPFIYALF
ncbi:MAG: DUF5989 family protein [Alphaproteobacteria bacterium]